MTTTKYGNKTISLHTKQTDCKLDSFACFLLWCSIVKGQYTPIIHVKSMLNLIVRNTNDSRKSNFWWESTKISPSLFLIFGCQTVPAKKCMEAAIAVIPRPSPFVVSLLSRDIPCECSISEGLAIVPLARHRFQKKHGQFNGCLHARLHENVLATENPENRRAYSSAFSSKLLYSRVICVFLRWGLI